MLIKVCDRCGFTVGAVPASVGVSLALDAPATKPAAVKDLFAVTLSLQLFSNTPDSPTDLCAVCRVSAVAELLIATVTGAVMGEKAIKLLMTRLIATIPGLAVKNEIVP